MNNILPRLKAFKRAPSLGLSQWENGNLTTNLAEKEDTNGAFFLVEAMLARGTEPPPHVHSPEDELFYVLDGEFDVYVGTEAFKVSKGECVFLPKFKPHAFVIRSPRLRVLALFTPAGLEQAFGAMSSPAQSLELPTGADTYSTGDLKQVAQLLADYGAHFLTPDEVVEQLPLYPTPLLSNAGKFTKKELLMFNVQSIAEVARAIKYQPKPKRYYFDVALGSVLLSGEDTGRAYCLLDLSLAPGLGVPRHTHTREDEAYFVVSGELEAIIGDEAFTLKAGETLMAPRNIPHQLRNSGNIANHYLIMFSPSGFEEFLLATSVPAPDDAPAPTEPPAIAVRNVFELAARYGIQFGGLDKSGNDTHDDLI